MFKALLVASLLALAVAQYGHDGYGSSGGQEDGGYGGGYGGHEEQHHPIPYKYGYDISGGDHHSDFKQSRQEHGDGHGNVEGSYSYTDSHGNQRVVKYVADHHGFRAQVQTNEPGTESQNPADVQLHSSAPKNQGGQGGYGQGGYGQGSSGYGQGSSGYGDGPSGYGLY